jgi:hypothetical protein
MEGGDEFILFLVKTGNEKDAPLRVFIVEN